MTKERADEIERLVIYKFINYMPHDTIDPVSAFHVGRMVGMMQETLKRELEKEVKAVGGES
jgi:hypothetical protein